METGKSNSENRNDFQKTSKNLSMSGGDRSFSSSESIPSFKRRHTMYVPDYEVSGEGKSEEAVDVKVRSFFIATFAPTAETENSISPAHDS